MSESSERALKAMQSRIEEESIRVSDNMKILAGTYDNYFGSNPSKKLEEISLEETRVLLQYYSHARALYYLMKVAGVSGEVLSNLEDKIAVHEDKFLEIMLKLKTKAFIS